MLDVLSFWTNEMGIDGWRLDVYWGPWRRYGPDRFGRPIRRLMKRLRPDAWLLGEIAGTGGGTEVYYADDDNGGTKVEGGLDAAYDWLLYHEGIRAAYGNIFTYHAKIANGGFWPGPNARYFRFLENHDEPRIAQVHAGTPDRIRPLTGMLLTATGIPMIYQGQEVNYGFGSGDTRRTAVTWDTERNAQFASLHQRLAHVRTTFPAFWSQELHVLYRGAAARQDRVYAFARPYLDENAIVAINFEAHPVTVSLDPSDVIDWSTDGPVPYYDVFSDTSNAYLDEFTVTIPPFETVVWITSDAPGLIIPSLPALPFAAVYTGTERELASLPASIDLDGPWPNPTSGAASIGFSLPDPGHARLDVFDMLGRRLAVLADGVFPAGNQTLQFDTSTWPSGSYRVRLIADEAVQSRNLIVIR
jgi:glycosidase